uniref:Uncharacterized protein n=1 Tax=Chromera velia CCMP2878 TaxID=1169474 RepID=A0A0G4GG18_9ALVE|eukprot:Cvel_21736.t1-p1 / transcript=Cvel_21736.t1 / gene=Cvel_21736 / organism=Chromera_velia_CCMP2878 / gene_product=hypothetical protein / transcript_product=hypothetical protein / location=Cvel_scaffold2064:18071-22694(+) / protein_length=823 / sequence_SO=supercontig / SO=protein_coding / is_pseudo=false
MSLHRNAKSALAGQRGGGGGLRLTFPITSAESAAAGRGEKFPLWRGKKGSQGAARRGRGKILFSAIGKLLGRRGSGGKPEEEGAGVHGSTHGAWGRSISGASGGSWQYGGTGRKGSASSSAQSPGGRGASMSAFQEGALEKSPSALPDPGDKDKTAGDVQAKIFSYKCRNCRQRRNIQYFCAKGVFLRQNPQVKCGNCDVYAEVVPFKECEYLCPTCNRVHRVKMPAKPVPLYMYEATSVNCSHCGYTGDVPLGRYMELLCEICWQVKMQMLDVWVEDGTEVQGFCPTCNSHSNFITRPPRTKKGIKEASQGPPPGPPELEYLCQNCKRKRPVHMENLLEGHGLVTCTLCGWAGFADVRERAHWYDEEGKKRFMDWAEVPSAVPQATGGQAEKERGRSRDRRRGGNRRGRGEEDQFEDLESPNGRRGGRSPKRGGGGDNGGGGLVSSVPRFLRRFSGLSEASSGGGGTFVSAAVPNISLTLTRPQPSEAPPSRKDTTEEVSPLGRTFSRGLRNLEAAAAVGKEIASSGPVPGPPSRQQTRERPGSPPKSFRGLLPPIHSPGEGADGSGESDWYTQTVAVRGGGVLSDSAFASHPPPRDTSGGPGPSSAAVGDSIVVSPDAVSLTVGGGARGQQDKDKDDGASSASAFSFHPDRQETARPPSSIPPSSAGRERERMGAAAGRSVVAPPMGVRFQTTTARVQPLLGEDPGGGGGGDGGGLDRSARARGLQIPPQPFSSSAAAGPDPPTAPPTGPASTGAPGPNASLSGAHRKQGLAAMLALRGGRPPPGGGQTGGGGARFVASGGAGGGGGGGGGGSQPPGDAWV